MVLAYNAHLFSILSFPNANNSVRHVVHRLQYKSLHRFNFDFDSSLADKCWPADETKCFLAEAE